MYAKKQVALFVVLFLLISFVVAAATIITNDQLSFDQGTYASTFFNATLGAVVLAGTSTGSYTSQIFDAGEITSWYEISWKSNNVGEILTNQTSTPIMENLLLLHLNENPTTSGAILQDSSGKGNDAILYADDGPLPSSVPGKFNTALQFNGEDYVRLPIGVGSYNFTLSAWFNVTNTSYAPYLYGERLQGVLGTSYVLLAFLVDGRLQAKYWYDAENCLFVATTTEPLNDGQWHNVVFTRKNATHGQLYVDGQLKGESTFTSFTPGVVCGYYGTDSAYLGTHYAGNSLGPWNDFTGMIDEVALYDNTFSSSDAQANYLRGILHFNVSVKSCPTSTCTGENFVRVNETSPQTINLGLDQYFQFKFDFETGDLNFTPELYNVTLQYDSPPQVNLVSPSDGSLVLDGKVTLDCSATSNDGITNFELYHNISGSWQSPYSTASNTISYQISKIPDGRYRWNCRATDSNGQSTWGTQRRFFAAIDTDRDGIPNVNDTLEGHDPNVTTVGVSSLNITVGGNTTNGSFEGSHELLFHDDTTIFMNFTHNFSEGEINLSQILVITGPNTLLINLEDQLMPVEKKVLYIKDNNFKELCVKNEEISSFSEISPSCTGANEIDFIECLGNNTGITINGITCVDTGGVISIANLTHSAIRGIPNNPPRYRGGGGGGGRSRTACNDGWDNDNDGLVDLADPGCINTLDQSELGEPITFEDNDGSNVLAESSSLEAAPSSFNESEGNELTGLLAADIPSGAFSFSLLWLLLLLVIITAVSYRYYTYHNLQQEDSNPFRESLFDKLRNRFRKP